MRNVDLAYLAGLIDGEGYIGIKKSAAYKCQARKTPGYHARIQVRMVDESAIKFLAEALGGWYFKEKPHANNGRPLYCFQASDQKAGHILKSLWPYLRVKKKSARIVLILLRLKRRALRHKTKVIAFRELPHHSGKIVKVPTKILSDQYVAWCESLWLRAKESNKVGV